MEGQVEMGRMEVISYEYPKVRRDFGHHPNFNDFTPEAVTIFPDQQLNNNWVPRLITTTDIDCIPPQALHEVNTERFVQVSKGTLHTDGAWPADVKTNDVNDRLRLLRRIKNEPHYQQAVQTLHKTALWTIQQNNTIDLYEDYFEAQEEIDVAVPAQSAKTTCVFRDPNPVKRSATKISWHPEGPNKMAVSYAVLQFQAMPDNMALASYIWDVNKPNAPDSEILPTSPLTCLNYNPRSPDHIVGGCYNGLVGFWDLRKGSSPVAVSVVEKSHHDPVYDIVWIQSRSGNECCSVSTDGQLLWWDIRKLQGGPTDMMKLTGPEGTTYGGTCIEYNTDAGPTRYLVGTEEGAVLLCDRKAKKDSESQKSIKTVFGSKSGRHHGPVYSVVRNPSNPKFFLSVGDWSCKIWMEDQKNPIMTTKYDSSYLTAACWSPTRPGLFFTTKVDGTLEMWDFFHKQNDPTFSVKIGDSSLCCIAPQAQGRLLALGAQDGTVTLLEISKALSQPQLNEKNIISAMLDRETKREKNLEVRNLQRKREEKEKKSETSAKAELPAEDDATQEALRKLEAEFEEMLKQASADQGSAKQAAEKKSNKDDEEEADETADS